MRKVIVNSTPLIALSGVGLLNILKEIYGEITIPEAVYKEIRAKEGSVCIQAVENSLHWIKIGKIANEEAKKFYKTQLHDGEVEVMILAKESNADLVIIDDNNAKKHAKYLGLHVTGTLGVLMRAKKLGYLPLLKPVLEQMKKNHIYISEKVVKMCLEDVDEL